MSTNKNEEEWAGVKVILNDFAKTCTIVGLNQIATRSSRIIRVMWAVFAVSGLCMALWQAWDVTTEYFKHAVIMKSEWRSEALQLLPAITICVIKTNMYSSKTARERHDLESNWNPEKFKLENKSKKYFSAFTAAVDWSGAVYGIDSVFADYANKSEDVQGWNNLQLSFMKDEYEECFTFNSAIDPKQWVRAPPYTGVTFYLFRNGKLLSEEDTNTAYVMQMSTPGLAPIHAFGDGGTITLEMGQNYITSIEWEEMTRIPNRGSNSDCVVSEGHSQKKSIYYSELRPYKYSTEACTKTMMQNMSLHLCNCYIETIPIGHFSADYPDAKPCGSTCAFVLNMTNLFDQCGVPCWEMSYRSTIQRIPLLSFQLDYMRDLETTWNFSVPYNTDDINQESSIMEDDYSDESQLRPEFFKQGPNDAHESGQKQSISPEDANSFLNATAFLANTYLKFRTVMVKVQVQSPMISVYYETPKYSLSDYWGIVGGNLGLWLGVSAITIAEFVELFIIMCDYLIKKCTRSYEISPVKSKPEIHHIQDINDA